MVAEEARRPPLEERCDDEPLEERLEVGSASRVRSAPFSGAASRVSSEEPTQCGQAAPS
jgi:hypothetical protein